MLVFIGTHGVHAVIFRKNPNLRYPALFSQKALHGRHCRPLWSARRAVTLPSLIPAKKSDSEGSPIYALNRNVFLLSNEGVFAPISPDWFCSGVYPNLVQKSHTRQFRGNELWQQLMLLRHPLNHL